MSLHYLIAEVRNIPFELSENPLKFLEEGQMQGEYDYYNKEEMSLSSVAHIWNSPLVIAAKGWVVGSFMDPLRGDLVGR